MKKKYFVKLIIIILVFFTSITNAQTNYAISLPGGDDGSVSNVALPGLNITSLPVTIEAWVYPIAKNDYGGVFYYRGANTNGGIQFDLWDNPNSFRGADNDVDKVIATNNINFNDWNHVAWVVTSTGMTIYINGTATTLSGSPGIMPFDSGLYIGWDAVKQERTIKGYFDEVRVWTTERTAQEIVDNKNEKLTGSETGLYGYWNFDDQANVATDKTNNHLDGTINGGTYIDVSTSLVLGETNLSFEETKAKTQYSFYSKESTLFAENKTSKNVHYKLYSINGQLVASGKFAPNSVTNLGIYKGVYIIKIKEDDNSSYSYKVLVE